MISPRPRSCSAFADLRIGLLGGSFNPAHQGHVEISLHALKRLKLDQIWWLVSPQNPLKPVAGMAPQNIRLRGAKALARHPRIVISDLEDQLRTRYTIDTLKALKLRFPKTQFVWLMGADNMQQMPKWRDWQGIFRLVPVAVFRRPAYAVGRGLGKPAARFRRYWRPASRSRHLATAQTPAWLVLDNKLNILSATAIRNDKTDKDR